MLLSYSDPETKAELEARKRLRDLEWLRGVLGDSAYIASLMIYGRSQKDAEAELNSLKFRKKHSV